MLLIVIPSPKATLLVIAEIHRLQILTAKAEDLVKVRMGLLVARQPAGDVVERKWVQLVEREVGVELGFDVLLDKLVLQLVVKRPRLKVLLLNGEVEDLD